MIEKFGKRRNIKNYTDTTKHLKTYNNTTIPFSYELYCTFCNLFLVFFYWLAPVVIKVNYLWLSLLSQVPFWNRSRPSKLFLQSQGAALALHLKDSLWIMSLVNKADFGYITQCIVPVLALFWMSWISVVDVISYLNVHFH